MQRRGVLASLIAFIRARFARRQPERDWKTIPSTITAGDRWVRPPIDREAVGRAMRDLFKD